MKHFLAYVFSISAAACIVCNLFQLQLPNVDRENSAHYERGRSRGRVPAAFKKWTYDMYHLDGVENTSLFAPAHSPLKLFTYHRDEVELLADWAAYHGRIFGPKNIFILDQSSQLPQVIEQLKSLQDQGFHVVPVTDAEGQPVVDWVQGRALTMAMRRVAAKYPQVKLLIPIDVDEFIVKIPAMPSPKRALIQERHARTSRHHLLFNSMRKGQAMLTSSVKSSPSSFRSSLQLHQYKAPGQSRRPAYSTGRTAFMAAVPTLPPLESMIRQNRAQRSAAETFIAAPAVVREALLAIAVDSSDQNVPASPSGFTTMSTSKRSSQSFKFRSIAAADCSALEATSSSSLAGKSSPGSRDANQVWTSPGSRDANQVWTSSGGRDADFAVSSTQRHQGKQSDLSLSQHYPINDRRRVLRATYFSSPDHASCFHKTFFSALGFQYTFDGNHWGGEKDRCKVPKKKCMQCYERTELALVHFGVAEAMELTSYIHKVEAHAKVFGHIDAVKAGQPCGRNPYGVHHCRAYERLYRNATAFAEEFYANRTRLCKERQESKAFVSALL
ncbi:hypothetical protein CEUSTIGMA_g8994.t1 [Chlamydomonas eustigma]|uniref:Glycosyltransferase family 92 protein n=1 Tax=Chlamydomonas eustigma TaxID=1157962 RepID=A0A250XEW2_9CHLO|nr:hypothetical protein CEUSTIGMA_g8994.t1 [Chlamydomonas eustigma]|eukprot:GAX81566.1 hypothetical protein CEUSTIGMA_g8994.t1 [Chlamydomonas eustigma]